MMIAVHVTLLRVAVKSTLLIAILVWVYVLLRLWSRVLRIKIRLGVLARNLAPAKICGITKGVLDIVHSFCFTTAYLFFIA
jgi:hypothetical protein